MGLFARIRVAISPSGVTTSVTPEPSRRPPLPPPSSTGPTSFRETNTAPAAVRPTPGPDEMRLRTQSGGAVTVTGEEHHQATLAALPPSASGYLADLVMVDDRIEVRIGGQRVGGLTPKMTERFRRLWGRASESGKRLTAVAGVEMIDGKGWQVTLYALPVEEGQRSIRELDIELLDEGGFVLNERSRKVHTVRLRSPEGAWRTMCGEVLADSEVTPLGTTKPYIGHFIVATGTLIGEEYGYGPDWCGRCL